MAESRDEFIGRLETALTFKAVEPQCPRCRATQRWTWLNHSVPDIPAEGASGDGATITRVCTQCGFLDSYDLALLLR
jgi:hypothetical protein